jgi:MOSC domain-containing protein
VPVIVTGLATTPVKGMRLLAVDRVELERNGARGNRRFYVIDERDRMVNGKQLSGLTTLVAEYSEAEERLALTFPDGTVVDGRIGRGGAMRTQFFSAEGEAAVIAGPWSEALSEHLGQPLRLVEAPGSVDRGPDGGVSLISRGSLARLAEAAAQPEVDSRRFRMLIEIDGVGPHAEDRWVGRLASVGDAVVRFGGHVGRCLITSMDPETGETDLPTLDVLRDYRGDANTTEPLPFGIYGQVLQPGAVRVGDPVALVD